MAGFLGDGYPFVKAFHIIFVIFWMAGLFMLPRFFAYHVEAGLDGHEAENWCSRQHRLIKIILNPSMMIAWTLGLLLLFNIGPNAGGWLHLKLFAVALLTIFHMVLLRWHRSLAKGKMVASSRFFRLANEIPSLFVILIVFLVIVRPF